MFCNISALAVIRFSIQALISIKIASSSLLKSQINSSSELQLARALYLSFILLILFLRTSSNFLHLIKKWTSSSTSSLHNLHFLSEYFIFKWLPFSTSRWCTPTLSLFEHFYYGNFQYLNMAQI